MSCWQFTVLGMEEQIEALLKWFRSSKLFRREVVGPFLFAVVVVACGYVAYQVLMNEADVPACRPEGFPSRCYNIAPEMCEVIWEQADGNCREYIGTLKLSPGRLTGPILSKCKFAHFDRAFAQARKSTAECKNAFSDLEGWKQRNDFN
ncbi:MAG: hypothetical protein AB7H97_00135 [Pseudobdellovibrionaceae bacterium]